MTLVEAAQLRLRAARRRADLLDLAGDPAAAAVFMRDAIAIAEEWCVPLNDDERPRGAGTPGATDTRRY